MRVIREVIRVITKGYKREVIRVITREAIREKEKL